MPKRQNEANNAAAAEAAAAPKRAKSSMKEKILHLLAAQEKFVGLQTIKKILRDQYDVEESKANNTRILKTLKDLEAQEEDIADKFGKVGGSYHGGTASAAYLEYAANNAAQEAFEKEIAEHADELKCPFCERWFPDNEDTWQGEDSIARGGKYICSLCNKTVYTWIGDNLPFAHKVEYRFSSREETSEQKQIDKAHGVIFKNGKYSKLR
jgi:sarcosine oxidase delta subunit